MRHPASFIAAFIMFGISLPALAECSVTSASKRVSLIELYTSEGCSSCPPADAWVSDLQGAGYTRDQVVPLALHVDYWDYIGWKDRFARAEFTSRQRQAASKDFLSFVYTPQVMLNGRDFRRWQSPKQLKQHLQDSVSSAPRATISMTLGTRASGETQVKVRVQGLDADSRQYGDIHIAVFENGLTSTVNAGENSGRELKHDHVVRQWLGPYPLQDTASAGKAWETLVMLKPEWKGRDAGVAAFVQHRKSGEVLQAAASPLCD
jgi:hypothetical protein